MLELTELFRAVQGPDGLERWLYRDLAGQCVAGTLTAVVGPNGVGKTTLLRHVVGLLPKRVGRVTLDGRPWESWTRMDRARKLAYLPQRMPVPDGLTVRDLVALGRTPHRGWWSAISPADAEAITQAVRMADVELLSKRMLNSLSGGELQRSMIARMLATQAPVLVLDEPTTSLDIRHALHVLELLRALTRAGRTVLVALHQLDLAVRYADAVILLRGEGGWDWGPTRTVLSPPAVEATFGVQVRGPGLQDIQLPARDRSAIESGIGG